jgi:diguanylate cyclase (GGDEF)-like protein
VSTKLAETAKKLRARYIEGLPAKWRVVKEALVQLRAGDADADESLRRIAHQVRGSAASFGFTTIDRAADKVEHAANRDELGRAAEAFITAMRSAHDSESKAMVHVLLIDDDPAIGFVMRSLLVEEILSVTQVTSAAAALSELEGADWSIIFVDLVLPDADGRSLLTQIRAQPAYRDTPLVVLSAKTGSLVKNECSMYGVDAFIEKPIDPATFAVQVASLLDRARGQSVVAANDALTGLANRVGFRRAFEQLAAEQPRKLTLAVIEIDGFDAFNATHGRAIGDKALTMVAAALRAQVSDPNLVARWGSEEFIVAFHGVDAVAVVGRLEQVSDAVARRSTAEFGVPLKLCAGVSELGPRETLDYALLRAEQLLYRVKRRRTSWVAHAFDQPSEGRAKLLVAEDDPMVAALLLRDLSSDYDILYVADGSAAVETALRESIDLFLLDYQMPGLDGVEVIRTLRERPEYRTTPMLLLTAVGSDAAVVAAFEAGADDYINKPHRRRGLLARIARHLGRAPSQAPGSEPAAPAVEQARPAVETEVTALFCDICGFTGITANLAPLAVLDLLNTYFPLIAEVVRRHGGTLEKYIGDAVLAIWGVPQPSSDDAVHALEAAVGIQEAVRELGQWRKPPLEVHIGLHSGPVVAANIGGGDLSQFAIVGDTTNLANRVCDLAGPGEIVLSAGTVSALAGRSRWPLGEQRSVELEGRTEQLSICELRWKP